jgi:hypothetical protein
MKSPWQLGLLALALTSVSAYDLVFFRNRAQAPMPSQAIDQAGLEGAVTLPGQDFAVSENADSTPPISREGLSRLAIESFQSHDVPEEAPINQWPPRDPFSTRNESSPILSPVEVPDTPVRLVKSEPIPRQASLREPQCIFSGVLIQEGSRLALVDGEPLSIGDRLGDWRLVGIEPEYISLQAGNENRRIALKGAESAARKDSL